MISIQSLTRDNICHTLKLFFFSSLIVTSMAIADDTEIFFGGAQAASAEAQPNILMILDTSGSMSSTDNTSPSVSRIDRVKESMYSILSTVDNVNIGLMRFNNPGGPILYPVVDIDGDACEVENCATTSPIVSSRIRNNDDDAEEVSDGSVYLFNQNLKLVENPGVGVETTTVSFSISNYSDDIEERIRDGRVQPNGGADYEMMDDSWSYDKNDEQLIGARFRNINIPANATITSAKIILTIKDHSMSNNRENRSVFIDVRGEKAANTTTFSITDYNLSNRPKTLSKVDWNITADSPSKNATIETPDLMPIVNEIIGEGWVPGNAMTFYFQSDPYATETNIDGNSSIDGNGMRRVYTRNSSSSKQPRLEISYVIGSPLDDNSQIVGLHFNDISVPQGATITDAFLDFTVQTASSGAAEFTIVAEKTPNSAAFDGSNFSLSSRIDTPVEKTTASVNWTVPDWNEAGVIQQSPNIKTIIQELVNQSDWCGANAISLFLTGVGQRIAVSRDLSAGDAPNLRISYDPDSVPTGGGNQGCINTIINKPVSASKDDAEQKGNGGMVRYSSDLDFRPFNNNTTKHSAMRFVDMKIPQGADILESRLELHLTDNQTAGDVTMTIKVQNAGDSSEFGSNSNNISNRPTIGSVSWTIGDAEDGEILVSPDISTLIQSVVNRTDWVVNNAITLIVSYSSGSGHKEITTYNHDPINAPRLIVKTRWEGNQSGPLVTNRYKMIQQIDSLSAAGYTPIVSVLDEARRYFEGLGVLHGSYRGLDPAFSSGTNTTNANSGHGTRYRVSHPASYTGGTLNRDPGCTDLNLSATACKSETISNGVYKSPMQANYSTDDAKSCQRNFIILLTDGQANAKSNTSISDISALTGDTYSVGSCSTSSPSNSHNKKCGPELTKYMYENDLDSTIANKQNITTYTIGFAFSSDWIKKVATDGGGSFFEASGDTSQLTGIFESILREIISVDTTFVSPGATVNQFNRLFHRNEVYFSLFKPGEHAQWDGNLKKYLLDIVDPYDPNDPNHPTKGVAQVVGQHSSHTDDPTTDNAIAATDSNTGFFSEDAQSFWSTIIDGSDVALGGAAEQISNSRPDGSATTDSNLHVYTDIGGSNGIDLVKIHENNKAIISKDLLAIPTETDTYHSDLIRWIRGVDVNSGTNSLRAWMGDPLHSHPGLVTYGGSDDQPILRLFVGTNDGFLHIIDAANNTTVTNPVGMGTGQEIFAFMPQELLLNQNTYYQNILGQHPHGLDGAISFWVNDINKDNIISGSDHVFVYFGLRRGGKSYYALDVSGCNTNPCATKPSIKWKIVNTDGSGTLYSTAAGTQINKFKELGQSWSSMELAQIKIGSTIKNVLIFGGGYDTTNDTSAVRTNDLTGRAIYIIDADTGERLWVAGSADSADFSSGLNYTSADMKYSIPADIKVIDITGDGLADQFYVGDMGGQIWRFDINNGSNSWDDALTGGVIADLAEDASSTSNRRFFYSVDVALSNIDKKDVLTLAIGSGWRSHPLDTVVVDQFFVLKSTDLFSAPKDVDGNIVYSKKLITDLLDVTEPENVPDGIRNDGASDAEFADEIALKEKMDYTGFYITMETTGEKIISGSTTFNHKILFSSFIPASLGNVCQAAQGSGRLYIIDLDTGKAVLDLNANETLEPKTDRYIQLKHGGIPPSPSVLIPPGDSPPIVLLGTESPLTKSLLDQLAPQTEVNSSYWRESGEYWNSDIENLKE